MAALFPSCFVRKKIIYNKNIQYAYSFYGTDLYVNEYRDVFTTRFKIYDRASLGKLQKNFIVDVRLGSKYASGINRRKGLQNVNTCQI